MKNGIHEALAAVLSSPDPRDLWNLRAELLEADVPHDARVFVVLDEFRGFLDQVATRMSSREYSELASKLDVGAVGGVVLAQVLEAEDDRELGLKLLTAVVSEGLMVLATRQHVRAWEGELAAVYRNAAWVLYPELWHWTVELKPDLPASDRSKLLDDLLGPVHSDATSGFHKAILVGVLFQVLLIGTVKAVASSS